jgi:hypothetical protein
MVPGGMVITKGLCPWVDWQPSSMAAKLKQAALIAQNLYFISASLPSQFANPLASARRYSGVNFRKKAEKIQGGPPLVRAPVFST